MLKTGVMLMMLMMLMILELLGPLLERGVKEGEGGGVHKEGKTLTSLT